METLVTVGIVAILCAIAIPSIITVNRSLAFQNVNNSARAVYLTAQSNLAQMRSGGTLSKLEEAEGGKAIPETGNAEFPAEDWNENLRCTVTGTDAFDVILPPNTLDSTLRDESILIEYNPVTGYVYAVFYSEEGETLSYSSIARDEDTRKSMKLGYYWGGGVTIEPAEVNSTQTMLSADTDGQELVLSLRVPIPESYTNHQDIFYNSIGAEIVIKGESSGAEIVIYKDDTNLKKELCIGSPNYIEFTFVLDSLTENYAFAGLNEKLAQDSDKFILGENLSFEASILFDTRDGYTLETYDNVLLTGVNSMFSRVEETGDAYVIEISNGRHLQNLNALKISEGEPIESIASNVKVIKLTEDIYWNETVEYYTDAYVTPVVTLAAESADYEDFMPIDTSVFADTTVFDGKGHSVLYLDINASGDAGLFGLCNLAQVKDLALVSPMVEGTQNVGALAGAANGTQFTNCSVYIDTEDEYFSWDKMDAYGVVGSGAVGGLVGYASGTAAAFSDCFAAVPVTLTNKSEQVDYAGGFVGKVTNAKFARCYASGDVEGESVGGFAGLSDGATFTQCFASGDVTGVNVAGGFVGNLADYSTTSITFTECYAVGVVDGAENGDTKATVDGFCGTGFTLPYNETNEAYFKGKVYQNTYYLNRNQDGNIVSLCAEPATYAQLTGETDDGDSSTILGWTNYAKKTYAYSTVESGDYPFLVYSNDLVYYGNWPEQTYPVALAYYEEYQSDNDASTEDVGFYITSEETSTLQNDRVIISDGYVLLVQRKDVRVSVDGGNITATLRENNGEAVTYNSYYIYDLDLGARDKSAFYTKVNVTVSWTDDQNQSENYTLYYNPDFAFTQVNAVFDASGKVDEEASYEKKIPSKIYIRTARHLSAIGGDSTYQGSGYNYIQMLDVNFTTYGTSESRLSMDTIADFAGSYSGSGGYVNQAKITMNDGESLFGEIRGTVSNIQVVYANTCPVSSWLAATVSGTLNNCDVTWSGQTTNAVATASETESEDTESDTLMASSALTGAMIGTVTETGTVTKCDLTAASVSGVDAGFVGINKGEITYCTVAPADGKTTGLRIGFAAENEGTIRFSMANTAATDAAFAGTNSGVIADCYAWYAGKSVPAVAETTDSAAAATAEETETSPTPTPTPTETMLVFAETNTGEITCSYGAIYGDPAYALLYNESGVATFMDTLNGVLPGGLWVSGSGEYKYAVPKGITHRGSYGTFKEYPAFSGYYYYEKYSDNSVGVYAVVLDNEGTEDVDESRSVNGLQNRSISETGYGIFTMTPQNVAEEQILNVAMTLDAAPIVPSETEDKTFEAMLIEQLKDLLDTSEQTYAYEAIRELSSESVYVLNGVEINTWFAPATEDGEYRIRTAAQFDAIRYFASEDFVQELDVTVKTPIEKFSGVYDGGENTVTYTGVESALFGKITGTVKNVVLDADLTVTLDAVNGEEVGKDNKKIITDSVTVGILADTTGKDAVIRNCRVVNPEITVKEEYTKDKAVKVTAVIGGLVGENYGTIRTSSVEGLTVSHTAASIKDEDKTATSYTADITVGGLVGVMAEGKLDESFATGNVTMDANGSTYTVGGAVGAENVDDTAASYVDCYAAVNITGADNTGAFIASAVNGDFFACHGWNGSAFMGAANAQKVSLSRCYYYTSGTSEETTKNVIYEQYISKTETDNYTLDSKPTDSESVSGLVELLNADRNQIWSNTTAVVQKDDDGNITDRGPAVDTKYPVLKDRYDANAVANTTVSFVLLEEETAQLNADGTASEEIEDAASEEIEDDAASDEAPESTEAPAETEEPESTETPVETEEPEATGTPAETAEPEITAEPVPTATPEVTPEPAAETEAASAEE